MSGIRVFDKNNLEIFPEIAVIVCPIEHVDEARKIASAHMRDSERVIDFQVENMLQTPLSLTGKLPVTHYGCVRKVNTDARVAMVSSIAAIGSSWCASDYCDGPVSLGEFCVGNALGELKEIG